MRRFVDVAEIERPFAVTHKGDGDPRPAIAGQELAHAPVASLWAARPESLRTRHP